MGWKKVIVLLLCAMVLLAVARAACADGPDLEVSIKAPSFIKPGEKATVTISVKNEIPATSYVDSVRLYAGDALLKEWAYVGPGDQAEGKLYLRYEGNFMKSATLKVEAHSSDGRYANSTEVIKVT